MADPVVEFYIQNYKHIDGAVVTTESLFQTVPIDWKPVITNPKVKNEMGKAGSLEFGLEYGSPMYDSLLQMSTIIRVKLFGRTIFRGRVLTIDRTMDRNRTIHCEGDLAFLLDSHQVGAKDDDRPIKSVYQYLQETIGYHNAYVDEYKRFVLGEVPGAYTDATPAIQRVQIPAEKENQQFGDTSWNTTMDRLEGLLGEFGGYFRTRYDETNHITYLDWLDKYYNSTPNAQIIEIAKNLIDLSGPTEVENLFTVVIPIGKRESENIYVSDYWPLVQEGHSKVPYIHVYELATVPLYTDAELNSDFHRKEDYLNSAIRFGYIWKTVDFENANTPEKLFLYAKDWIKNNYMPEITQWDVSALDLRFLDGQEQPLMCGDCVHLRHPEVDQTFGDMSVISAEYDLYNPDKNKYTIGIPNQQINSSYGVKEKTSSTSGGGKVGKASGGVSKKKKPPEDPKPEMERDLEAIRNNILSEYAYKTVWGGDIHLDDPLAFTMFNQYGEEIDEEDARAAANYAAIKMKKTKETWRAELEAEAARRGCAWDDDQLVIEFTPELAQQQQFYRDNLIHHLVVDCHMDEGIANTIAYESAGQSTLAGLVDDNGNWTQLARDWGIPREPEADHIREMAIRTRKELQGDKQNQGRKIFSGLHDFLDGLGINIGNYVNFGDDDEKNSFRLGSDNSGDVLNTFDFEDDVSGLINKGVNWLNGLFQGNTKTDPETGDKESNVKITADGAEIDSETGSAAFGEDGDLDGWKVTINRPLTYTAEVDGEVRTFTVPPGAIAVDDIHFTKKYDSLRAELAVVDVLLADYAHINSLEALQAEIGALRVDYESLRLAFGNETDAIRSELIMTRESLRIEFIDANRSLTSELFLTAESLRLAFRDDAHGLMNLLEDTASYHRRTLSDDVNSLKHILEDTASYHRRSLTDEVNGLKNILEDTASYHRRSLTDDVNSLKHILEDTASYHRRSLTDEVNGLKNILEDTASYHRRSLTDDVNSLKHILEDTASYHRRSLTDEVNGLKNILEDTASYHRRTLSDDINSLKHELEDTASYHRRSLTDEVNGLKNILEDTASYHRRTLSDDINSLKHELEDTVSMHRRTLTDDANGLKNEIIQTASMSKQTLTDDVNGLKNEIIQTASMSKQTLTDETNSLKNEIIHTASYNMSRITNEVDGLETRVEQTESQIALKVSKGDVVTQLRTEVGNVYVEGGNLIVDGLVTAPAIATAIGNISGYLHVNQLLIGNTMMLDSGASFIVPASSGGISIAASKLTLSSGSGEGTTTITPSAFLKAVQIVPTGAAGEYKLQYKTAFASENGWQDAGTFSKATATSKVVGSWSGGKYRVGSDEHGQELPIETTVILEVERGIMANEAVAKIYHTASNNNENLVLSKDLQLIENVNSKTVTLQTVLEGGTVDKASVSTQRTYNAGWRDSFDTIEVLPDEDVALGYGESHLVTVKAKMSPTGELIPVSEFTISAPSSPTAPKVSGTWNGATYKVDYDASGQELPVQTSVSVGITGSPNPNQTVYAHVYKTTNQSQENILDTQEMTLTEDVVNKQVTLTANTLTKGAVPTLNTYNAGFDAVGVPTWDGTWSNGSSTSKLTSNVTSNSAYFQVDDRTSGTKRRRRFTFFADSVDSFNSSGKAYVNVQFSDPTGLGNHYIMRTEVDGSNLVKSAEVIFYDWLTSASDVYSSATDVNNNTIIFANASNPTVKQGTRKLYLTQDSSFNASHKKWVYMRDSTVGGSVVAKIQIDASSEAGQTITPKVKFVQNYTVGSTTYDYAVIPTTDGSGSAALRTRVSIGTLSTSSGTRTIQGYVGSSPIGDPYICTDYKDGRNSIINAGGEKSYSSNGTYSVNQYVTTLKVNVSGGGEAITPKVKFVQNYTVGSTTYDYAVIPTTDGSGSAALRTRVSIGNLSTSSGTRTIQGYVGSSPIGDAYICTDYKDGQNSIINAGGEKSYSSNGTYSVNQYVTTLKVNVSGGGGSGTVSATGTWNASTLTYKVTNDASGATLASTNLIMQVEGNNTTSPAAVHLYHTNVNNVNNRLASKTLTLTESSSNKRVTLYIDGSAKSYVSTQATFNAGKQYLIDLGSPFVLSNISGTVRGTLNRYVTDYTLTASGAGTATVVAPTFDTTTVGTQESKNWVNVTATSSNGSTSKPTTTQFTLRTNTYTPSGSSTKKNCVELYWGDGAKTVARIDIANTSATVADAEVSFSGWTQPTGNSAGWGNTVQFSNASNSQKHAERSVFLTQSDGWVYMRDDSRDGLVIGKIQVSSGGSVSSATVKYAGPYYDETTHIYTVYAQAEINGSVVGNAVTITSGTEAYDSGVSKGFGDGQKDVWRNCISNIGPVTKDTNGNIVSIAPTTNTVGHYTTHYYAMGYAAGNVVNLYRVVSPENLITIASYDISALVANLQDKDVTISRTTTITPDDGFNGMSSVTVRVNRGREITLTRGAYNSQSRTYTFSVQLSDSDRTLTAYVP